MSNSTVPMPADDGLPEMLAKHQIREVLSRYARAIDRGDGELLRTCYHPDAVEEHAGNYAGNAMIYIDQAIPRVLKMAPMQHLLGSAYIELDDDDAAAETYVWTMARLIRDGVSWDTFTGGRLLDRFQRRNGSWKILHRKTIFDWNRDVLSAEGWALGMFKPGKSGMLQGCKGPGDPSYEIL